MPLHEKTLVLSRIETRLLPRHSALRRHRRWLPATYPGWTPRRGLTTRVVHAIKHRVPLMSLRSGATPLDSSANSTSSARTVLRCGHALHAHGLRPQRGCPGASSVGRDYVPTALAALGVGTPLDRALRAAAPLGKISPALAQEQIFRRRSERPCPAVARAAAPAGTSSAQAVGRKQFGRGRVARRDAGALHGLAGTDVSRYGLIESKDPALYRDASIRT